MFIFFPRPRPSHDSGDIGIVQSAVCNSSKLLITFSKCPVTQEPSPCCRGERGRAASGGVGETTRLGQGQGRGSVSAEFTSPDSSCKSDARFTPEVGLGARSSRLLEAMCFGGWGAGAGEVGEKNGVLDATPSLAAPVFFLRKAEWEGEPAAQDPAPSQHPFRGWPGAGWRPSRAGAAPSAPRAC